MATALGVIAMLVIAGCSDGGGQERDRATSAGDSVSGTQVDSIDGNGTRPDVDSGNPDAAGESRTRSGGEDGSTGVKDGSVLAENPRPPWSQTPEGPRPVKPPCADGGCEPRSISTIDFFASAITGRGAAALAETPTVEETLEMGVDSAGASPVHIAIRGTAQEGSTRCEWRGIARTAEQREQAIRFWLELDADDDLPSAAEVERRFMEELRRINPVYPKTVGMNFRALALGGLSTDYLFLTCYVDYTVHEYILGSGPTGAETLSVSYDQRGEARSYDLYRQAHGAGEFGDEEAMTEAEYADYRSQIAFSVEMVLSLVLEGRESVLFLAPMGAHQAIAVEAWQVVAQWDLQTDDGGTVNAVRYGVSEHNPESSQTFTNLEDRVNTAAEDDEFADERMENVDELDDYYEEIGAYDDITPDDGETTTFTPAQPPSVPSCANGTAVTDPSVNRVLVHDCEVLLDNKDTLAGTASLDWAADSAITSWEGVTTGGTPSRVTELDLPSKSLTGSIPAELGTLFELTTLDLSGNSLTGEIPAELGLLENLVELSLSGNTLTGCIPVALEDVATNDLSTLGLLYCAPPAPESLSAGSPGEVSIPLTWDAVSNTSKYRVEYRLRGPNDWTTDDDTLTATTHTVDELVCESPYQFRVSAYGSGTTYAADWSEASGILSETTGTCVAPEFDAASYTFSVAEDAAIDDAVGTVSATDSPGDTVSYEITAGNDDDAFAINSDTGEIAVASEVDEHTASPTALTVEARDLSGGTTEATVDIYINRPPSSLIVTPSGDHRFSLTWSSVPGADYYTLHYKEKREGSYDEFILTSNTFKVLSTDDGCATPYEFWLKHGHGWCEELRNRACGNLVQLRA